ncbi:MAG: SRPBCC family protein [Vicinamibacterales bacterium]
MVLGSTVNSDSFKVSTPSDREIRMTRLFNAPRALVFEAMTKPEHVKQWWGRLGEGYSVPLCEIDLRPGGRWRFVNKHPHGEAAFHGEYREIAPPGRLVFTEIFEEFPDSVSVVTAEFTEEGGKTRMTATVQYESLEVRDMVLKTGMSSGAAISYDRLEDLLATLGKS